MIQVYTYDCLQRPVAACRRAFFVGVAMAIRIIDVCAIVIAVIAILWAVGAVPV